MDNRPATPLAAVWSQVTELLSNGYSLIPVRDKEENGRPAKSPYPAWKKYQSEIIKAGDMWEQMERYNTTAIAVICGKISGNLEVIDIDVKYKPGIDAKLFSDIKLLYPDIWARLRLHRSPSGGFHIPYKIIDQPPPGNMKLASRETVLSDFSKSKTVSFIETRGEGGIILIPPSLGYSVYKAQPIPLITWEERSALIALAQGYNEIIKIVAPPKTTKFEEQYYDENPFEHFNRSQAGHDILVELGWKPNGDNGTFRWFTKPGSKSKERHGSFIKDKNLFFFWTTNTEFETGKCYTPSTILSIAKFGGDYKLTYKELVQRGYGRIKENKEAKIIRTSKAPPANLSKEKKDEYTQIQRERSDLHPHGIFWQIDPEGQKAAIDREGLYKVAEALGFRLHRGAILKLVGRLLYRVEEREFQDQIKAYIREKDAELYLLIVNTYEHFLQLAGKFTLTRLPLLDETKLMQDGPTHSFKFFSDCWIKITSREVYKFTYEEMDGYIFAEQFHDRPFVISNSGKYIDFLNKAVEFEKMRDHVLRVIGYLAHEYKDETTAYIIVLTEQCPDPKSGGGSGKNLFCNLFKHISSIVSRPGEQIKYDASFFQAWNGQRLYVISDAPKDFRFIFLKELSSGTAILKKLFKDERTMSNEELPKMIINTNYSYEIVDGGLKRRIIPLEFTDFFTKNSGVRIHYGVHFPTEWEEEDWAGYNQVMVEGIQAWLGTNMILVAPELTTGGWRKQFEQSFGKYTADFIYDNFENWANSYEKFIPNIQFKEELDSYFNENGVAKIYHPSVQKVSKAIEEYAHRTGWKVDTNSQRKVNSVNVKGKKFTKIGEAPEEETPF